MTNFRADVFQNEFLAEGAAEVNAVITITATDTGGAQQRTATGGDVAEVIVIDRSGSMEGLKLREAKRATEAAIDAIADGVLFAVVAGSNGAYPIFPGAMQLVRADDRSRDAAKASIRRLSAEGGTYIGTWLTMARELFSTAPGALAHAILLTDGQIDGESLTDFRRALEACRGVFECDCRGVGTDWVVSELREIADTLLGTVDIVADPAGLADDFRSLMNNAMSKGVKDVSLRVWAPQGSEIVFVKKVAPTIEDVHPLPTSVNPLTRDFPTGNWGDESRDYHVCIRVVPGAVGQEKLAARVSLVVDDQVISQALVRAVWTDDSALSTKIDPAVAHYTGQADLAQAIKEGLDARAAGDLDTATRRLGQAVQIAAASGNEDTMKLLGKVVDVEDADRGTVRLKRDVDQADAMALDTRSTKTVRTKKVGP